MMWLSCMTRITDEVERILEKLLVRPHTVSFHYVNVYNYTLYMWHLCAVHVLNGRHGIPHQLEKCEYCQRRVPSYSQRSLPPSHCVSHPFGDMTICPLPLVLRNNFYCIPQTPLLLWTICTQRNIFIRWEIYTQKRSSFWWAQHAFNHSSIDNFTQPEA